MEITKAKANTENWILLLPKKTIEKLKHIHAPTFVVGIDIERVRGYIVAITQASTGGIYGIPVRNSLNCRTLKALWKEVDDYWRAKNILTRKSRFTE